MDPFQEWGSAGDCGALMSANRCFSSSITPASKKSACLAVAHALRRHLSFLRSRSSLSGDSPLASSLELKPREPRRLPPEPRPLPEPLAPAPPPTGTGPEPLSDLSKWALTCLCSAPWEPKRCPQPATMHGKGRDPQWLRVTWRSSHWREHERRSNTLHPCHRQA